MGDSRRPPGGRKILGSLLESNDLEPSAWIELARQRRSSTGLAVFSELIGLLTHVRLGENEAEDLWPAILAHRNDLARRLGRDVGLRVALFDWFVNIDPRLKDPTVLELAQFEKTEKSAMTDWLTGLYNRGAFRAAALRELRRAQRYRQMLSILLFDLDDFKEVNDSYGHDRGDLVLRETSRLLRRSVRDVDIASRYGGEEFAVLLPETGREGAAAVAERVRTAVARQSWARGSVDEPLKLTVSGGISVYPEDGAELGDLLRQADNALYRAKASGKNTIVFEFTERRSVARRIPLAGLRVRVTIRPFDGGRSVAAQVRDMSSTGFGLTLPEPFEAGQRVELTLEGIGKEGIGSGERLDLTGRIVRRAQIHDCPEGLAFDVGVGLEESSYAPAASAIEKIVPETSGPESLDRSTLH